jgi:hypothetical protein
MAQKMQLSPGPSMLYVHLACIELLSARQDYQVTENRVLTGIERKIKPKISAHVASAEGAYVAAESLLD